jgi:hypothetical protein
MHRLQNVCEQVVIIGVLNSSLQTWHRSADSSVDSDERGVPIQSVGSETVSLGCILCVSKR